jgi:exosortase K
MYQFAKQKDSRNRRLLTSSFTQAGIYTQPTLQTTMTNKNISYYLPAIGLFVLLKIGFTFSDNNDLIFLLKPTDKLVGLLTGSPSVFWEENGFFHEKINIVIDKSCSGFNFWMLCFLVFTYLGLKYFDKHLHKMLIFPTALFCAYLLTIFANASRIFASIIVQNQTANIFPNQQFLIHEAIGIITYFSFLVLVYYLMEKFLKHKKYAQLA